MDMKLSSFYNHYETWTTVLENIWLARIEPLVEPLTKMTEIQEISIFLY